ncbi:MAG: hypothetical protein H6Q66_2209 [Firmicutes bacterium]|nr:hypothetical protein [Bacillota bacterium]
MRLPDFGRRIFLVGEWTEHLASIAVCATMPIDGILLAERDEFIEEPIYTTGSLFSWYSF